MADTTTTQIVQESPDIEAYRLGLLQSAKGLLPGEGETYQALPGYQVAGMDPLTSKAAALGELGVGSYLPFIENASEALTAGQTQIQQGAMPALATASLMAEQAQPYISAGTGRFDPSQVSRFMDPYLDDVVDTQLAEIQRLADLQKVNAAGSAVGAGAFGGSRSAVQRAEIDRNALAEAAKTGAALRSTGYNQAMQAAQQAFEAQKARNLQAAQQQSTLGQGLGSLAAQAGQFGTQLGQLGLQQASLGELQSNLSTGDIQNLINLGGMRQQQQQNILEAQRQTELQDYYQPYQGISFLSDIYAKTPSSQQTISVGTSPAVSPFQQVAGLGIAGLAAASGAQNAGLF